MPEIHQNGQVQFYNIRYAEKINFKRAAMKPAKPADNLKGKSPERQPQELIIRLARAKVKSKVSPRQYQMYDLIENKRWDVTEIEKYFSVSQVDVRKIKDRIVALIEKEIKLQEVNSVQ